MELWGQHPQEPGLVSEGRRARGGQRPVPQGARQPWPRERPRQRRALGSSTYNSLTRRQDTKSILINKYPKIPTDWFLMGKGV